ncbi:unnamed protein product [Allacma fusca]|uniref:Uncharacterized protein n=1 Tax=Allacma fusca TaxID=39272 RepID=A0A8J2LQC3_9HEXA|nr:unnamed protein product [Allacma fusca]
MTLPGCSGRTTLSPTIPNSKGNRPKIITVKLSGFDFSSFLKLMSEVLYQTDFGIFNGSKRKYKLLKSQYNNLRLVVG